MDDWVAVNLQSSFKLRRKTGTLLKRVEVGPS